MTVLKGKQKRAGRGAINSSIRPKDTVGLQLQGWGWGQVKRVSDSLKNRLGYFHLKKYQRWAVHSAVTYLDSKKRLH